MNQLMAAINQQPTSVSIEADQSVFQHYTSGVINSSACGTNLDHAVLAVGYVQSGSSVYYIVKNSWGTGWGESGYVNIMGGYGAGTCGIQSDPSIPYTN